MNNVTTDAKDEASQERARMLPLLSGEGNQRLLLDWIEGHDSYRLVDPDQPVETAEFDCCVLDGDALKTHAEVLRKQKAAAEPVLLPFLLLLPEADLSVLDADQGEIADGVVFETVDEVVAMPIKKAELEWRTDALLRLRSQSIRLDTKRHELRLFKQATEAAGHAVYITDSDGRIEYVNQAFEEMTGYESAEVTGETPQLLDSGEMPVDYFDRLWETISAGDTWAEEIVNRRKNGELYPAYQTIAPVTDEDGDPSKFVAIQSDITQRVEAEQNLRTFRDIVERIDDPIMLQDRDGRFQIVNEALTEYAGMSREGLIGENEYAFMDGESAEYIEARKQQVLAQEAVVRYSISPTFPEKSDETFSTVRYPYYGENGTLDGTVAICRNVTGIEVRDQQLTVIDRVLRHNLRNDMTSISMFAEKLRDSLAGEEAEYADRIHATSEQVNRMVDKQREITKFLTDPPSERELDLVTLVQRVVERQRDSHPDAEIQTTLPGACLVNATGALEQALLELLENAIAHADRERPSIEVEVTEADGPTVTVADDGPGIPEMEQTVLTSARAIEPLYHGSGLGLWLVNLIVTHSDGRITFSENEPCGSVVTLRFPGQ